MSGDPKLLHQPRGDASWMQLRLDARRDTRMMVQKNVAGHVHVTIGTGATATLILHPHAAKRLISNINAVLDGAEFAAE